MLLKDLKNLLKIIFKLLFSIFLHLTVAHAAEVQVLELNHAHENKKIIYSANVIGCKIENDSLKLSAQNGALAFFDKIYYDFEIISQNEKELIFQLKSAKNFEFHYALKGPACIGILYVKKEEALSEIKSVEIDYRLALGFPTVKRMNVFLRDSPSSLSIGSNKLDGYTPFYEIGLGFALNIHSNIRKNEKRTFNRSDPVYEPMPTFMVRYGPLFASRDGFGMVLLPLKNFAILTTFLIEGEPYTSDFIRRRKRSLYFGPLFKINLLEILYYKDVKSVSNGEVIKISLSPEFRLSQYWTLNPRFYYQYWDRKYVDYYFNVSEEEAANLHTHKFEGDKATNYGFMVNNLYKLDHFDLLFSIGYKFYGSSVSDSPLVIRDNEFRMITGFIYKFL